MTNQAFAKPPHNAISTVLQVTTVVVGLLLGAAFVASMFSDSAEETLRAAQAPVARKHVRS